MGKTAQNKPIKTPVVLQMEAVECGAACLGIILGYYKKFIPLEQLRIDCGVSRDGSNAGNIMKASKGHGLDSKIMRFDLQHLPHIPPPYVVFWKMNHFVVVEGFYKQWVYVNDPEFGRRRITPTEFSQGFTGICLLLTPNDTFEPGGKPTAIFPALWSRLDQNKSTLLYLILLGLCLVVPGLLLPIFAKVFIDNFIVQHADEWIKPLILGMLLTAIFRVILVWVQQYYLLRMETKLAIFNESYFLWHVLRLPTLFFGQRYAGDIANRIHLNDQIAATLARKLSRAGINALVIIFYAMLMFYYDIKITLFALLIATINLFVLRYVNQVRQDNSRRLINEESKLLGAAMNGLSSVETLKASGTESDFFIKWSGMHTKIINIKQKLHASTAYLTVIPTSLSIITTAIILGLGGYDIMQGNITIGMLVALQTLAVGLLRPIEDLVNISSEIQELQGDISKLDDVLDYSTDPIFSQATEKIAIKKPVVGALELKNITFGYNPNAPPIIKDFSLSLKPGERIAIVGPSGSGKSTITHLIMRLHQPWSGEILLDGHPINHYDHASLTNSIGIIEQSSHLFAGTIRMNLCMWDLTISESNIIEACKDAMIHSDITARQGAYHSKVITNGLNFSGGQRQRLEIARSLARNPKILVMDEATSALDAYTEYHIDKNIRRRGCATIIVAHRLSTIRDSDEIIVLDQGEVVERGQHEELLSHKGVYHQLVSAY